MKIKITASLFGYMVGGHNHEEEIEIEEWETKGMNEEEIEDYIEKAVYEYIKNELEWGWEIK